MIVCLFKYKIIFWNLSFYKKIVTLKLAFSSRQQGPLGPPWLIFNIKELSYFSTRIVHTATVFFWILDSFVYHMYFTHDEKVTRNFPCPLVALE
jgi:hypothetical protein